LKQNIDLSATRVIKILDIFPEMVLQNRRNHLKNKFDLIMKEQPARQRVYMRNLFTRHPDLFLTSYASIEAKASYIKRNLNRPIHKENAFPLLLLHNYSLVIWPRCQLLVASGDRGFKLAQVLTCTDEEFCAKYSISMEALQEKKQERTHVVEKDKMWVFVNAM
jgi:hypothetical protein